MVKGYENPLEGLEDKIGKAWIWRPIRGKYLIADVSEEELVEVMSALGAWQRDLQHSFDVYNDFSDEMNEDEEENYKALQYSSAVVKKFVESLRPSLEALGLM